MSLALAIPAEARSNVNASATARVVVDRPGQQLAQPISLRSAVVQRVEHRQRVHTLAQVGAGQLAGLVGVAVDVDDVVGDLERRADDVAQSAEPLDLILVGAGEHRAELAGRTDQAGRLLVHHLQVVPDRIRAVGRSPWVSRI